jgi:uncharacterized protein (DUF1810 family)
MAGDRYDLERFIRAQDEGGTYQHATEELRRGRKTSHWMWFVFPQVAGLGNSSMARRFAIASLDEAQAYLEHTVLGDRLRRSVALVAEGPETDASRLLGAIDAVKLRSSMTLFLRAAPDESLFAQVLDRFFDGEPDAATDARLFPIDG